ncbi:MAG: CpsD/CapB family tyrosine-protein kinase [Planctomycetes bacterium]|nr:CpsD/CapB family tyrosine-protein kinase [Planctomycetota bacterium]
MTKPLDDLYRKVLRRESGLREVAPGVAVRTPPPPSAAVAEALATLTPPGTRTASRMVDEEFFSRVVRVPRFDIDRHVLVLSGTQLAEEYRQMRTHLQALAAEHGVRVFGLTSCHHAEGKTSTAINTARFLAKSQDSRVVLLDCDLRRPGVKGFLGHEPEAGMDTILAGETELASSMVYSEEDNLHVVFATRGISSAAEALESSRFEAVIATLRPRFDFVVIDTPPLLSTTDPAVIGKRTDGMALVVQAGATQRESVHHARSLLEQVGVQVLGIVLAKVRDYLPRSKYLYRYHYYHDYYNYYKYYREPEEPAGRG